jgi:hypothetical protein
MLERFSLQSVKFNLGILLCCLLLWASVVGCTIASIRTQRFTTRQRWFWIALVVLVPLIGVAAYLPFSFSREEMAFASLRRHKSQTKRRTPSVRPGRPSP